MEPWIDVVFPVLGQSLPADHGYGLYAALAHANEALHGQDWLAVQTIRGLRDGEGRVRLSPHAKLRIRLPVERIPFIYPLAGRELTIGIHTLRLGIPEIRPLAPCASLRARLVVIKGFTEPEAFLEAAARQLAALEVKGRPELLTTPDGTPSRKTIKIKRFTVVGFGLRVAELSDEDSIKLQIHGLGGKRRMGCGVFYAEEKRKNGKLP